MLLLLLGKKKSVMHFPGVLTRCTNQLLLTFWDVRVETPVPPPPSPASDPRVLTKYGKETSASVQYELPISCKKRANMRCTSLELAAACECANELYYFDKDVLPFFLTLIPPAPKWTPERNKSHACFFISFFFSVPLFAQFDRNQTFWPSGISRSKL